MTSNELGPVERSVRVDWDPETAFRRFTDEFDSWWPSRTHSVGGDNVVRVVFEGKVGGLIYEELDDGRRFQWGTVKSWDPPRSVRFSWHPSRAPETAQDVELTFVPDGEGTRLELVARDWERWGAGASRARRGYSAGWNYILNVWAHKHTPGMRLTAAITSMAVAVHGLLHRGSQADQAEGEIVARS